MNALDDFMKMYSNIIKEPPLLKTSGKTFYDSGILLAENGTDMQKEDVLTRLIYVFPEDVSLYNKMGNIFKQNNLLKTTLWYKMGYQIDPYNVDNTLDLCDMFFKQGLPQQVFSLNKNNLFDHFMENRRFLGIYSRCFFQEYKYQSGLVYLKKLIEMNASIPCKNDEERIAKWMNYHDIGYVYCAIAQIELAIEYTEKAVELANKFNLSFKNRLLSFSNQVSYYAYHHTYDEDRLFKTYLKINDYYPNKQLFKFHPRKGGKIRIGYVSSDFVYHAVANFLLPILKNHDLNKFEIYMFSNAEKMEGDFLKLKHKKYQIMDMPDKDVARLIHDEKIDILVDLNGHTVDNRLGIFALNPAPIQIAYLGYPNTTGLHGIKYRITDAIVDPIGSTQPYSEELLRLPKSFLIFRSIHQPEPELPIVPQKTGGQIILAAINKENKNSLQVLETWKNIMAACPQAIILIKLGTLDNNEEQMAYYSEKLNVNRSRIIMLNKLSNYDYVHMFEKMDILLDTYPYSGTTTTCNAMYNSIPVVSLYKNNCHAHNVTSSILINSGLSELVARTPADYVRIVVELVNNPARLDMYKKTVREKFMNLMDIAPFMKSYEQLLCDVYNR